MQFHLLRMDYNKENLHILVYTNFYVKMQKKKLEKSADCSSKKEQKDNHVTVKKQAHAGALWSQKFYQASGEFKAEITTAVTILFLSSI